MGDNKAVQRLVEMLSAFYTEGRAVEEDLTNSLTNEFLRNIQDVLLTKQVVSFSRYEGYFNEHWEKMLSDPETYIWYVFNACMHNVLANPNIFERFLSAFAIIIRTAIETRLRTRANFCKLVPDMFKVLYEEELKNPFGRRGGICRFVQYINNPNYLESKCAWRNISSTYDPDASINEIPVDLLEKAYKMNQEEKEWPKTLKLRSLEMAKLSLLRATKVLKITKPEFVPSLSKDDLKDFDSIPQSIEQPNENKRTLETHAEGNSDSNDGASGQIMDSARYDNIIEAVIRFNHSKISGNVKSECDIQTEADRILEHLKKTTKSLIDVLDEYDK